MPARLFCIDSDMTWEPDAFMRMLALSTKADVVLRGVSRRRKNRHAFTSYARAGHHERVWLHPMPGGGLGFAIINRKVIEHLGEGRPDDQLSTWRRTLPADDHHPASVSYRASGDGEFLGEDMMFFRDIEAAGFRVLV